MSSGITINLNGMGGSILGNNDSFLSIPFAWEQEPITCQIMEIIIYIGVYEAFPHMKYLSSESNEIKQNLVL